MGRRRYEAFQRLFEILLFRGLIPQTVVAFRYRSVVRFRSCSELICDILFFLLCEDICSIALRVRRGLAQLWIQIAMVCKIRARKKKMIVRYGGLAQTW